MICHVSNILKLSMKGLEMNIFYCRCQNYSLSASARALELDVVVHVLQKPRIWSFHLYQDL